MSGSFEKETAASTAKSLVGALVALGAGFVFMFLGLVAVSANSERSEGNRSAQVLQETLQTDLLTYQTGSASVSKDQLVLKFRKQLPGKAVEEITYKVIPDTSEVSRIQGGQAQKVVKLSGLRFESSGGLLRLQWKAPEGTAKASWALNRWAPAKGGA